MKSLLQRIAAVMLGAVLCFGIALPVIAEREALSPICRLGTDPSDMLSGGGRRVLAGSLQYYIDDTDGAVYELSHPDTPILEGPVTGLNWEDDVLYYARLREEDFDLCAFDLKGKTEQVLLKGFSGRVRQLYLVNGKTLEFSSADEVWRFSLADQSCTQLLRTTELWSFVPTGCGLIYATGNLFDYSLYANGKLLARHVQDYSLRFDLEEGLLVYNCGGEDHQLNLAAAFAGEVTPQEFVGCPFDPEEEMRGSNAWERYVPPSEAGITRSNSGEISYHDAVTRGTVPLFSGEEQLRLQTNEGVQNIVRRARQMLNIQWTPVGAIPGWGYTDLTYGLLIYYDPGVTYRGLPYGQAMHYVPWNTSYSGFLYAVQDIESEMYTERCNYDRGSQSFGTDCSGFVSWAWETTANGSDTPERKTCPSLITWDKTVKIGRSYTQIQLGDAIVSGAHAVLVTDVTYASDGTINSIEISQASPTVAFNGCCYSTRYIGTAALQRMNAHYFVNDSYSIYRSKVRDSVSYTHDCNVPVEGDVCDRCGCGVSAKPEAPQVKTGIDVSVHNGLIDWKTVAPQIDFAILRVGYTGYSAGGIYKDSSVAANIQGCVENKIPFGLYYYAGATTPEKATQEADAVLGWLLESGVVPALPIFYDVEEERNILTVSDEELAQICTAFCEHLEDFGFRAGIYASHNTWQEHMKGEAYDGLAHWVAHWRTDTLVTAVGANLWQHTESGRVAGISGTVDMNYWLGELGSIEHPSKAVLTALSCVDGKLITACVKCDQVSEHHVRGVGHSPGEVTSTQELAPSCTEAGARREVTHCSVCGQVASDILVPIDPLGHDHILSGVVTVGQTPHESSGLYTCNRCGETAEAKLCAKSIFTDMPKESHWAHDAIDWAYFNGLFRGVSADRFALDLTMNRAMLVTVLYNIAGQPEVEGTLPFLDVKKKAYYYKALLWANQIGVASGTSSVSFSPNDPVSREQVSVMLLRYLCALTQDPEIHLESLTAFPDKDHVSKYALSGMAWAVEQGIVCGSQAGDSVYLLPRSGATRAQVAVMFMRFTKLLQEMELWAPLENWGLEPAQISVDEQTTNSDQSPEEADPVDPVQTPEETEAPAP